MKLFERIRFEIFVISSILDATWNLMYFLDSEEIILGFSR